MPAFFDPVTELLLLHDFVLILKIFCLPSGSDNLQRGKYVRNYQVEVNGRRGEVSSDKYFALASDLSCTFQLHVFTDGRFSGVVLTPLDIRKHARLIFVKHRDYERTGKVLVKGILKADLPNPSCYIGRRGFRKLLRRDARYGELEERFIVGSSDDEVPSSPSMGLGHRSEEQTPTHEVSSSSLMGSGRLSEEQTSPHEATKWPFQRMKFFRSVSCKVHSRLEQL